MAKEPPHAHHDRESEPDREHGYDARFLMLLGSRAMLTAMS